MNKCQFQLSGGGGKKTWKNAMSETTSVFSGKIITDYRIDLLLRGWGYDTKLIIWFQACHITHWSFRLNGNSVLTLSSDNENSLYLEFLTAKRKKRQKVHVFEIQNSDCELVEGKDRTGPCHRPWVEWSAPTLGVCRTIWNSTATWWEIPFLLFTYRQYWHGQK